ncbi:hypothetical protein FDECE_15730 [Fusarium decemcellulare]|nr:hypothetical protein FDECE_15730 [Fusarium decemcellulare]
MEEMQSTSIAAAPYSGWPKALTTPAASPHGPWALGHISIPIHREREAHRHVCALVGGPGASAARAGMAQCVSHSFCPMNGFGFCFDVWSQWDEERIINLGAGLARGQFRTAGIDSTHKPKQ